MSSTNLDEVNVDVMPSVGRYPCPPSQPQLLSSSLFWVNTVPLKFMSTSDMGPYLQIRSLQIN